MEFEPVIGLEVHAQLKTDTKIFCGCSTAFGAPPNTQTCPVCLGCRACCRCSTGRWWTSPLRMALATGCTIARESRFARKNYFYPDLPKGYQISQYELPIAEHGHVDVDGRRRAAARPHPAHPHGGGRRQAHPRPAAAGQPRRPEPGRRAADRDRERAGPRTPRTRPGPTCGSCARSCATCGSATATSKRAASAATPTSRSGPGAGRARDPHRAEEPELLPLRRAGDRVRDRAPEGGPAGGRHRRPGDAPVGRRGRPDASPCAARRRPTTTAISRTPTCCPW